MDGHRFFRAVAVLAFVTTYVTLLFGGNVMASDSGLACPDWPTCQGSLLAPLSGAVGIEWSHRLAALVLSLVILALTIAGFLYESRRPILRNLSVASLATVVGQALLGGLVVESGLSIGLVLAHFLLATVLFGLTLVLAILANLREVPRRWIDWAWRAVEDRPAPPRGERAPAVPAGERAPSIAEASPRPPGL